MLKITCSWISPTPLDSLADKYLVSVLNAQAISPPLPPLACAMSASRPPSEIAWNLLATAVGIGLALKLVGPSWAEILLHSTSVGSIDGLIALFAALGAAIFLHEAGHLSAALLLDFDVLGGSLGPLRAVRLHGRWSFQFSGALLSGSVIAIPRRNDATWRTRMLAVVAAGPIATLLTGLGAACLLVWFAGSDLWLARFLSALVELNFFLFVLGLFPNAEAAKARNDARLFYSLLRNTPEAQQILLYHLVTQLQIAGVRPRDYPQRVIFKLAQASGRAEMCVVYANAIALWAFDRGDLASADAWDKRAMDLSEFCNLKLQNSTAAASACLDVILRGDLRAAANKFADVQLETLSPRWLRHRSKAVYWLTAGNIPETLAEIARAQYSFPNRLPYYDFERMLLGGLHRIAITTQPRDPISRLAGRAS